MREPNTKSLDRASNTRLAPIRFDKAVENVAVRMLEEKGRFSLQFYCFLKEKNQELSLLVVIYGDYI